MANRPLVSESWSNQARINAVIVALAMAVGTAMAISALTDSMRARRFVETDAVILHADVAGGGRSGYRPDVRFRYRVGGREYEGTRLDLGVWSYGGREGIERTLAAYSVGASVKAWYYPRDPSLAVLRNQGSVLANLLLALLTGGACATAVYLRFVRREPA